MKFQPCNASGCLLPETVAFTAVPVVAAATPPAPVASAPPVAPPTPVASTPPVAPPAATPPAPRAETPAVAQPASPQPVAAAPAAPPTLAPATASAERAAQNGWRDLFKALLFGFVGGMILNLMPCVLPVIGLKILSFLEQAGQSRRRALTLNLWYSAGLLSVFAVLAALASFVGMGWGQQFGYLGFNITLTAVVFAMGLSFLGVWEIPVPGFVGRGKVGALAEREGASGAFAKGALTTVLATPCSAPFLGSALTWALAQPPAVIFAVFLAVGLGMASPYLLLGAFPELLRFLPKPGVWMETFKELMGFVLLGTVIFLLTLLPGAYVVPTVGLLFGIWLACWWIGRTPYTAELGDKVRVWLSAVVVVGITFIVTFGWLAEIMQARYVEKKPFSPATVESLVAEGNTVLVDFTADWCLTCKTLEATVLNTEKVQQLLRSNGVVSLKADWTNADPEVTKMLKQLGSAQVPVIAIYPAGKPQAPLKLIGGYTQQSLLEALQQAGPSRKAAGGQGQRSPTVVRR